MSDLVKLAGGLLALAVVTEVVQKTTKPLYKKGKNIKFFKEGRINK